jgi:hypothetical protein
MMMINKDRKVEIQQDSRVDPADMKIGTGGE